MSPRSRRARRSPRRRARREQRVQLRLRPVELGGNLAQPALHRCHCALEREILVARRQGKGTDALAAEDGLHAPRPRSAGVTITQPIASASTRDRHEHEAIAELCPQSLAQDVDDRLVPGVEDERDRLELQGLDLALVELCELGDERQQAAQGLDVARQHRELGSELLDPRRPAARPAA